MGTAAAAETVDADLVARADEIERDIVARGLVLLEAPGLSAHVDSVGRRLLATIDRSAVSYRFHVLRDPAAGAMSLPNGAIYVFLGLPSRLANEAQLAWVLAHEIAHVERRHAAAGLRELRRKVTAAKIADLLFAGLATPMIGHRLGASLGSYSREQEEEADGEGLRILARAGYRAAEAEGALDVLERESPPDADDPYRSHPSWAHRRGFLRSVLPSLGTAATSGATDAEGHRAAARGAARLSIELALARRLYALAIADAERELSLAPDDPWLLAAIGEGHRLMASDPDGAAREAGMRRGTPADPALAAAYRARAPEQRRRAEALLRRAIAVGGENPLAHRGLGLLAHEQGDPAAARWHLERYLQSPGPIADRSLIRRILDEGNP